MQKEVEKHDDDLEELNKKWKILDGKVTPRYIVSEKYQKWHICQQWQERPSKEWKTACGWRYGKSVFERKSIIPGDLKDEEYCTTCFDRDANDSD